MKKKYLYTFTFIGGGFNQVHADNKREALKEMKAKFSDSTFKQINISSIKRLNEKQANEYWNNLPLWD